MLDWLRHGVCFWLNLWLVLCRSILHFHIGVGLWIVRYLLIQRLVFWKGLDRRWLLGRMCNRCRLNRLCLDDRSFGRRRCRFLCRSSSNFGVVFLNLAIFPVFVVVISIITLFVIVALFFVQLGMGTLNLLLMAPIPMQLVHLLLADAVWITLVLLTASALSAAPAARTARAPVTAPSGALPRAEREAARL